MFRYLRTKGGSILVYVLLILLVLSILGITLINTSVGEAIFTKYSENNLQARYYARSGAEAMLAFINKNPSLTETQINNYLTNIEGEDSSLTELVSGSGNGFKVKITDETTTGRLTYRILSTGYNEDVKESISVKIEEIMPYDFVIHTNENLDVTGLGDIEGPLGSNGTVTAPDPYTYDIQEYLNLVWESTDFDSLPILTENSFSAPMQFTKNSTVNIDGTDIIVTDKDTIYVNLTDDPAEWTSVVDDFYYYDDIIVGQNKKLVFLTEPNQVTRIVTDTFTVSNNSQVVVDGGGFVSIFVESLSYINNGTTGFTNNPEQLAMFMKSGSTLRFGANAFFNGFIYGPETSVEFDPSSATTISGAVIANNFDTGSNNSGVVTIINGDEPYDFSEHPDLDLYVQKDSTSALYKIKEWK